MIQSANNFVALFLVGRYRNQGYMYQKVSKHGYVLNKPLSIGTDAIDYRQHTLADGRYLVFAGGATEEEVTSTITGVTINSKQPRNHSTRFRGGINGLHSVLYHLDLDHHTVTQTYDDVPEVLLKTKTFTYDETNIDEWKTARGGWTLVSTNCTSETWPLLKRELEHKCPYARHDTEVMICATSQAYQKKSAIQAQLLATAQRPLNNLLSAIMQGDKNNAKEWYYQCMRDVFNVNMNECWDWDTYQTVCGSVFDFIKQYLLDASGTITEALKCCIKEE